MKQFAINFFKNREGNCAEAVSAAWHQKKAQPFQSEFVADGNGNAPEGLCGALYAAKILAGHSAAFRIFVDFALKTNGYVKCSDIRKNHIMACKDCVALATELLEQHALERSYS